MFCTMQQIFLRNWVNGKIVLSSRRTTFFPQPCNHALVVKYVLRWLIQAHLSNHYITAPFLIKSQVVLSCTLYTQYRTMAGLTTCKQFILIQSKKIHNTFFYLNNFLLLLSFLKNKILPRLFSINGPKL